MGTPRLRQPIVLVHGLLGYDRIRLLGRTLACYFTVIPEYLEEAGNRVLLARLSPTGGIADRAGQLKNFLNRHVPKEPVHLIAHSLGGLDARYLISRLGMADRVLTLTTIATPHRGSPFADWGIRRLERVFKPFFHLFDIPKQAFYDLTTASCRRFNETVPDVPSVRYFSVAGRYEPNLRTPEWYFPYRVVAEAEGPNDGVVSVASAAYGQPLGVWDGDHLSLVNGGPVGFLARRGCSARVHHYGELIARLADEGFAD